MTTSTGPLFYKPVFGNDNGYVNSNTVDVAAFTNPAMKHIDAALTAAIRKPAK